MGLKTPSVARALAASWVAGAARLCGCCALLLSLGQCTAEREAPYTDFEGADAKVQIVFRPATQGKVTFGDAPFPDVLYTDEDSAAPSWEPVWSEDADAELTAAIEAHLDAVDGFGIFGPIYFPVSGELDPESLPSSPEQSEARQASVFVIDADTNSPRSYQRVPVQVEYDANRQMILVRPEDGKSFRPGRSYAAVVTRDLLDSHGDPVGPTPAFAQVRDALTAPEGDGNLLRAYRSYRPLLGALAAQDIPRERVIGLASFRVQTVANELSAAHARVVQLAAEPELAVKVSGVALDEVLGAPEQPNQGLSAEGGVEHSHISEMIHGTVSAPQLLARKPFEQGYFSRNQDGELEIKRVEEVPFTLFMPTMVDPQLDLPLVVYIHDMDGDRSDALAIADRFAAKRMAVVAFDGPFDGQRSPSGQDQRNRFTAEEEADGFGDASAALSYFTEEQGALAPFHPLYFRDALRQTALDVLFFLASAREHSLASLTPQPFDLDHVALLGVGTGGTVAMMVAALDEGVQTVVPANCGSGTVANWLESPGSRLLESESMDSLTGEILRRLGIRAPADDATPLDLLDEPALALYQMLLDRVEPVAWAPEFEDRAVQILQLAADRDEWVSAAASDRFAAALDLTPLAAEEIIVSTGVQDRAQATFPAGTHGLLLGASDELHFETPFEPPFMMRDQPERVEVPFASAADLAVEFVFWQVCISADGSTASCQQGR